MNSNKRKEQSGTKGCSVGYERSVGDEEEGRECVENLEPDRIVYKRFSERKIGTWEYLDPSTLDPFMFVVEIRYKGGYFVTMGLITWTHVRQPQQI